ncbi:OmpA family protein [Komarekiella sp. 'clone 1']|uniref:OmpA family protein n=1 Tax=Komarekiella delphini-convector SJRDD-AB1 TaxID=2593771 RepID=A0AA40SX00_9NOST|nr:OmpA family protein [Komarekiella delphini-convector]MBD6616552.1 OmpA family protein [Komarekiella delphini-convector SJRDD-AB1]
MNDSSKNEIDDKSREVLREKSQSSDVSLNQNELSELRSLLFDIEPNKLNKLYERLDNPQIQPEDISQLLPEAVILRSKQDKLLGEAIVSTVEEAIHSSIKQDHNILSEAFFPIIGPAARKAISASLDEMIQSLNQTLEYSLSLQSFKWRLDARRTGKSFAEIVLLRTLVYRVEQVFLIHKKTGLLLQHLVATKVGIQDPVLVSAMLTAIQDFVQDSFTVPKNDVLQSLQFGELTIWIEQGPQALLASIIRGKPPQELRLVFRDAIEKIHLKLSQEINDFAGETQPFEASKTYLEACLAFKYKNPHKKNYTYAWAFLGTTAIASGIWGFFAIREQFRWNAYIEKLNSQPGIVVISTKQITGKYFIFGMRDPLAVDPNTLIQQTNLNPKTISSQWKPYLSLEPQFITKRVEELLQPPKSVSLQVDNNGILQVTGFASRQWIQEARKLWHFIPGVTQFQETSFVELELKQLELYKNQIEQTQLFFREGSIELIPGETDKLNNFVLGLQKLLNIVNYLEKNVEIQIIGHTNTTGTEQNNMLLSQARANKILSHINFQKINTSKFRAIGVSSSMSLQPLTAEAQKADCRVSFKVLITNKIN